MIQKDSEGIRIYYGFDQKTNQKHLLIASVNKDGLDIEKNKLLSKGAPCPPFCPPQVTELKLIQTFNKVTF